MDSLAIRIRRVVWHGAQRPEAAALAEAIESALALRLSGAGSPRPQPLAASAEAVAREIAARIRGAAETRDG